MKSVGEILRAEREKQKLAIKDVEKAISIRAHYLNAIEEGNFDVVPGEIFLKGFIRNYAEFLGLNGAELVGIYRQNRPNPAIVSITTEIPDIVAKNADFKKADKLSDKIGKATRKPASKMPLGLISAALIAVCIGGGTIWYFMSNTEVTSVKQTTAAQAIENVPANSNSSKSNVSVQTKPVTVSASFVAECWIVVLVDGKDIYEGIPPLSETISWEAERSIVLKLGNAGGVDIIHNGKALGKVGKLGEVVEKVFTPTFVKNNF